MAVTVPEAATRTGRNPETIRRWIREGKLPATKVGTQHVIDEGDLDAVAGGSAERLSVPAGWDRTLTGEPMPNWVALVHGDRSGR